MAETDPQMERATATNKETEQALATAQVRAAALPPARSAQAKCLVKTPKLYILDTGLCAYLTEWPSPETLEAGAMSGPILETWILTELPIGPGGLICLAGQSLQL